MKRPSNLNTTQRASIKEFLKAGNSITALEALSLFGAYRLAAHIEVLRNRDGMKIVTTMNKDYTGRPYARYHAPQGEHMGAAISLYQQPEQGVLTYASH